MNTNRQFALDVAYEAHVNGIDAYFEAGKGRPFTNSTILSLYQSGYIDIMYEEPGAYIGNLTQNGLDMLKQLKMVA